MIETFQMYWTGNWWLKTMMFSFTRRITLLLSNQQLSTVQIDMEDLSFSFHMIGQLLANLHYYWLIFLCPMLWSQQSLRSPAICKGESTDIRLETDKFHHRNLWLVSKSFTAPSLVECADNSWVEYVDNDLGITLHRAAASK